MSSIKLKLIKPSRNAIFQINFIIRGRMFRMFRLFDNAENNSIKEVNQSLLEITFKNFPPLNTTELEVRHSLAFAMLKKLDVESPHFDAEYNLIIAGAIIYALTFETTKYGNTLFGNLYLFNMPQLFEKCHIPDSKIYYEELILVFGKKALEEKVIPFDSSIIKKYFGCFYDQEKNPLKNILLKRYVNTQNECLENNSSVESEQGSRFGACNLF